MASIGESEFDRATAVSADGAAAVAPGWDIGGNANGGYLLALAARGLALIAGRPDPVTVTGHFLAPGVAGPVTVEGQVLKAGRRFATVSGALRRGDTTLVQVLGAFGDVAAMSGGFQHVTSAPPELPPIEECASQAEAAMPGPALLDRLRIALRPGDTGFGTGERSGVAEIAGWLEFADGRPMDPLALLLAGDAFPPAVFHLPITPGWVPTVEYTVQIRGVPAPGPLRCLFRSRFVQNGCLEEDGEVWDSRGELVALSRQLGLLPRA